MSRDINPNPVRVFAATSSIGAAATRLPGLRAQGGPGLAWFAVLIALIVIAPVLALLGVALSPAASQSDAVTGALGHLLGTVLPGYAMQTLMLVALVLVLVLILGVGSAWLIAAFEFPGRRFLEVALILPLAMPAFVMAYAYTDALDASGPLQSALRQWMNWEVGDYWFPQVRTLPGAAVFLALALYPYVYMLARSAFADRNPTMADAARSLGLSPVRVWWQITWPVARPSVAAGVALVTMETLADFGTVSFFAVDTFSAGIYRAWQSMGDRVTAAQLALVLLVIVIVLVRLEHHQRGRMAFHVRGPRPAERTRLSGRAAGVALALCAVPVLLGFVVPCGLLLRSWWLEGGGFDPRLPQWLGNTALLSGMAVFLTVPCALAVAYALRLAGSRGLIWAARLSGFGYAIPGVVMGVGLLAVLAAWDRGPGALTGLLLGGSALAVVYAYCARFFAVAQQGLEAALQRISPSMDASARSLGCSPMQVLVRVHWPLLRVSLATAALLVFVDCLKELPATLVLRPFNMDTLAVVSYQFASDERLAQAALPSLLIVLASLLPVLLLARTFAQWQGMRYDSVSAGA
jgi:iron(III) transport system permease protein